MYRIYYYERPPVEKKGPPARRPPPPRAAKQQDKKDKEDVFHAKPVKHKPNNRNRKARDYSKGKQLKSGMSLVLDRWSVST